MDNDLNEKVDRIDRQLQELITLYNKDRFSNLEIFRTPAMFLSGITTGTGGLIIGQTGQKIGFLGKSAVVQQPNIAAPSGGSVADAIDSSARSKINEIIAVLDAFGFTA